MMSTQKLYRVICCGMTSTTFGSTSHGDAYVIAKTSEDAYRKLREYLDISRLGTAKDRALHTIELIAEDKNYPECGKRLFI